MQPDLEPLRVAPLLLQRRSVFSLNNRIEFMRVGVPRGVRRPRARDPLDVLRCLLRVAQEVRVDDIERVIRRIGMERDRMLETI